MATCPHCGHEPPAGSVFCNGCGGKLVVVCASCGATPPPGSRFCNGCGAPLAPADKSSAPRATAAPEERKVISILFADLMGSTALQERLDPESVNRVMDAYYQAVRGPVEAGGGKVVQLLGDGVLCAFGIPRVAEDDAVRAVRAAIEIQQAFRTFVQSQKGLNVPIGLRVAVNTGEVVVSDEHPAGIGDPLNVAARLQQEARDGEVLIGPATRRLVAGAVTLERAGEFALKGRADAVTAYRVLSLERPGGATTAAFVGRDDELARITAVGEAAFAAPAARLAVVLGSPGLGKSRLIDEVAHRFGDAATVITAQCDAAGGTTFAPIARAVRAFRSVEDDAGTSALGALIASEPDRERIAAGMAALLEGKPASPEETFFVIRRFLTALAGSKPVVLVIDDLHWAEPLLLDLVEHLVQWGGGVRLLVLVGARPELRDLRSSLVTPGGFVSEVITLAGLDASAAMRLAANAIGAADLPSAVAARVLATSEGNPLFVGELVRMLVDEGAIERSGDRWIIGANLASFEMPPTIHALLAARIERLRPEERAVLEHAAVVGRHFSRSAVAALIGESGSPLDARLEALRRTELIEPDVGWFLGEPVLRFHHVLIRDAAYRRLLKGTRAALHQRLADWIEAQVADAPEHDETIGWHLEQAHQHLCELGPLDDAGRSLGERAAQRLLAAGRRALAGDDVALAAGLLGRAIDLLDPDDPSRAELALDWCEALLSAGEVGPAAKAIDELARFAADNLRLRAWHTCFTGQLTALTAPQNLQAAAGEVAAAAEDLAKLGDAAGEAKAHSVHAQALSRLGKVGACEAALDKALAAARKAGDRRRANAVLAGAPVAALGGPSPVTRASGRCLDVVRVLRITQGAPAVEAVALSCQGVLEALRGRTEAARRMIASSRKMVEELGIAHRLFEADVFSARIDLLEGDAASAERTLRGAYEGLRDLGLGIDAARASALLARAQLAQDRVAEAEASTRESEALAGDDLQAAIAWRGVRAEALARRGETDAAVELAQAGVAIASATDALLDHADARMALAAALRAAGRDREADAEERRAVELWEAKGATLLAERARRDVRAPITSSAPALAEVKKAAHRSPRLNTATAAIAALDAGFARGDNEALVLLSDAYHELDHRTGATWNREGAVESVRRLLRSRDPQYVNRPLATLGDSLVLLSRWVGASGAAGGRFDVGEYGSEALCVLETDARGLIRGQETFAADRLDDAVVRLYERYAEPLPDGPVRNQVTGTLALMSAVLGRLDFDHLGAILGPHVAFADHRRLGLPSSQGREAYLQSLRVLFDRTEDVSNRLDDILALGPSAFAFSLTNHGTDRVSGGAFERPLIFLGRAGPEGLATHWEFFDSGCEAEALARFDELVGGVAAARAVHRRVRPNAASAVGHRFESAVAARDFAAAEACFDAGYREIDHSMGSEWGRDAAFASLERLFRSRDPSYEIELLATLGERLALNRRRTRSSGDARGRYDVGPYEHEAIQLAEIDERGLVCRQETYATNNLGDAIVRLYERYAALLPEGPARARAAQVARSLAAWNGPTDPDLFAATLPSSFRLVDHRVLGTWTAGSREEFLAHTRLQLELAPDFAARWEDVYALDADALVSSMIFFGTARDSGGPFENRLCDLHRFGADGRITEIECFEAEQAVDALARFDELTSLARPVRRRVRLNAAAENEARIAAAVAAKDLAAVERCLVDSVQVVHHPTGSTYGRSEVIDGYRNVVRSEGAGVRTEALATLGDTLALSRSLIAFESSDIEEVGSVGALELELVILAEVDGSGRRSRAEVFAADRLGDAVVRLYERYAELLPEGPARARAAGIARSLAAFNGPTDLDAIANAYDSAVRDIIIDHRVLATWNASDRDEVLQHFRLQLDLALDFSARYEDVFALAADALVARLTFFGTARDSGGAFENKLCVHLRFGADGRFVSSEVFEAEQVAEALARFDELVAVRPAVRRRVRANAASRSVERFTAELATRDEQALGERFDELLTVVHHPTSLTYGRREMLTTWRSLVRARRLEFRNEHLASVGESLTLDRHVVSFEGFEEAHLADVGLSELEEITLIETDANGRWIHVELFAPDRLGDAIARLYERHAELLPEGPARSRAAGVARSVAAYDGPVDPDQLAPVLAPSYRIVDHRVLHTWSARDAQEHLTHWRLQLDLAPDFAQRFEDVFACDANLLLVRLTAFGTAGDSGGAFENRVCVLFAFGADGRITKGDIYEAEQAAEVLARFEQLAGGRAAGPGSHPFDNAASRADRELFARFYARDWAGIEALAAPELVFDERRRMVRNTCGREVWLEQFRVLFDVPASRFTTALRATRGERLALSLHCFSGEVAGGGGPLALDDHLVLHEVDRDGRIVAITLFDLEDEDAAWAELDRRYENGEGAAHPAHGAFMRAYLQAITSRDWDPVVARMCGPTFLEHDHRRLAVLGTTLGSEAWVQNFSTLTDLAPDSIYRVEHFRSAARGFWCVGTWHGSREGGSYELPINAVLEMDERDHVTRADIYDLDQADAARARFAELAVAAAPSPRFANAASRSVDHQVACYRARDWRRFTDLFSAGFRSSDRRRIVQLELGRDGYVAFVREVGDMAAVRLDAEVIATRGDLLVLARLRSESAGGDVGSTDVDDLNVFEVDERGACVARVRFDLDDLDTAYAELDARYDGAEGAALGGFFARFAKGVAERNWDAFTALCSPAIVEHDHRPLTSIGITRGRDAYVRKNLGVWTEVTPDTILRFTHVRGDGRAGLVQISWEGGPDGGRFEVPQICVGEWDEQVRLARVDVYDLGQLDQALARFAEIEPNTNTTTATAAMQRAWAAFDAGDFDAARALCAPDFRWEDRRRLVGLSGDIELMMASARERLASGARHQRREILGTAGDRIAIGRVLWAGGPADGRFEVEFLTVHEVDEAGLCTAMIFLDPDDLDAAQREAASRRAAIERPDPLRIPPNAATRVNDRWVACAEAGDWKAVRNLVGPGTFEDRRPLLRTKGDLESMALGNTKYAWGGKGTRARRTLLATAGDRLALERVLWTSGTDPSAFEVDLIQLTEVDAEGRVIGYVFFDPSDRVAASAELFERYAARGADVAPLGAFEGMRAWNDHDLARLRAVLPADFYLDDRRRTGVGRLDGAAAYLESLAALWELSRDLRIDVLYFDRISTHGYLYVTRWSGTNAEGGEFDAVYVCLGLARDDRPIALEIFELEDFDAARARFEELRPH